jgi:peptidoglycan/LPS O-acetylase OafA/YrhL
MALKSLNENLLFRLSQLYRTFDLSFTVALHRATPYLIGIALGIVIKEFGKVKLATGAKASGWLATLAGMVWCYYKPSNLSHKDYQYDPTAAAQYSALAPLLWGLSISWIIFACHSDESWALDSILSSRFMIFISRISYSIFLIIFIVFFYFSGTLKSSEEFHVLSYLDRLETCTVIIIAVLFTLVVDLPAQNIVKLLLGSSSSSNVSDEFNKSNGETSVDDEEIENIFANDDDDFVYKPKPKYNSYGYDENVNGE